MRAHTNSPSGRANVYVFSSSSFLVGLACTAPLERATEEKNTYKQSAAKQMLRLAHCRRRGFCRLKISHSFSSFTSVARERERERASEAKNRLAGWQENEPSREEEGEREDKVT